MKRRVKIGESEVSINGRLVSLFEGHGLVCKEYKKTFRDEKSAEECYSSIISRKKHSS
jgi:hypothetical protein